MLPINVYPYLNLNDLNLDFIMKAIADMKYEVTNFVSINAIKYADPIQWDITRQYEKNTIVIDPVTGTAYISVAPVPAGVSLTRTDYWTVVFDLGSFVTRAAQNFTSRWESETTTTATFASNAGDWLVWGDVLYKALVNITAGDTYVVGSNIEHFTIEDLYNAYLNTIATILAMIGDVSNLTTHNTDDLVSAINELNMSEIKTPEMFGAIGDGIADDTAAVQAAINAGKLIKINNNYRVTNTLFIDGIKSIIGDGTITFDLPYDALNLQYGIVCGATAMGVTGATFEGAFDGVNFLCLQGHFNYVLALINANNCAVRNCTFDLRSLNCNCANKVIFGGSDAALADTSTLNGINYRITNNLILFDDSPSDPRNLCESIGFLHRNNIIIDGNYIRFGKDDLGIHRCEDVIISNNTLAEVITARIYVSNSRRFKVLNNTMTMESTSFSQGIQIEWETTMVSATEIPEDFVISNNIIDYTNTNYAGTTYGIRISGAIHGIVTNNELISNTDNYGNIVLENEPADGSLLTRLVVQGIELANNRARQITHNIGTDSGAEVIEPLFIHDNVAESRFVSSNYHNIVRGNVVLSDTGTLEVLDKVDRVHHNVKFIFAGTGSLSWQGMKTDYETVEYVCTSRCLMSNRIAMYNDASLSLSGSDYFAFELYKNGTLIRGITLQVEGPQTTNFNNAILDVGDKITARFKYTGSVPSPQPNAITFMLKLINFDDIA